MNRFSIDSVLVKQYLKEPRPLRRQSQTNKKEPPIHLKHYMRAPTPLNYCDPVISRSSAKSYNGPRTPQYRETITPFKDDQLNVQAPISVNISNSKEQRSSYPQDLLKKASRRTSSRHTSFRINSTANQHPSTLSAKSKPVPPSFKTDKVLRLKPQNQHGLTPKSNYFVEGLIECHKTSSNQDVVIPKSQNKIQDYRAYSEDLAEGLKLLKGVPLNLPFRPRINLPPHNLFRKTVILDLDETLVHCIFNQPGPHQVIKVKVEDDGVAETGINIRPYCKQFLTGLSKLCEIIVFTASNPNYADAILDHLDPDHTLISHRLYRTHCTNYKEYYFKDLRNLNRELQSTLIVDNSLFCYLLQLENGVPVLPYFDDPNDTQLLKLLEYLKQALQNENTQAFNNQHFMISNLKIKGDIYSLLRKHTKK